MRTHPLAFAGVIGVFVALAPFAAAGEDADAGIEIRDQVVAANELRLLVETYRRYTPGLSHSSKAADAKGYLITADLSSDKPAAERAKVFGPLWDVPNARSSISFSAVPNFTKEDAAAAAATPWCLFDDKGTLLRFTRDKGGALSACDELVAAPAGGSWKRRGDVKPVPDDLPPGSEDRLATPSRHYILLRHGRGAALYDVHTGRQKDDPWLTGCFLHAHSIDSFENVRWFLTEDLNHLVASPMDIWNEGPGKLHETFVLDGKTYKRRDVGLAYSRTNPAPVLFPRKLDPAEGFLAEEPHGACSIDGRLYLFMNTRDALRLYTLDGGREMRVDAKGQAPWPLYPYLRTQDVPDAGEVVFFDTNEITRTAEPNETVSVTRWNYRANTVTRRDTKIADLFAAGRGGLRPKSAVAVR